MRRRTEKRTQRVALALENLGPEEREAVMGALEVLVEASGMADVKAREASDQR